MKDAKIDLRRPITVEATIQITDRAAYERLLAERVLGKAEIIGGRWDGLRVSYDSEGGER